MIENENGFEQEKKLPDIETQQRILKHLEALHSQYYELFMESLSASVEGSEDKIGDAVWLNAWKDGLFLPSIYDAEAAVYDLFSDDSVVKSWIRGDDFIKAYPEFFLVCQKYFRSAPTPDQIKSGYLHWKETRKKDS